MKTKKMFAILAFVLVLVLCATLMVACNHKKVPSEGPGNDVQGEWTYSYSWADGKCTATRVIEGTDRKETEVVDGTLTVEMPATKDQAGSGYYTVKFKKSEFNANYNLGNQPVVIPAGSALKYGKSGLNTYFFNKSAGKNYYAEMTIEGSTQSGWVGFVHSADATFSTDGTYFYDAVSYKAGRNYEHEFGSVIDGENLFNNTEVADSFEGASKSGLTGANFATTGMTITSIRNDELIYLFINGKRVATYLVEDEIAVSNTVIGLYFDNNSTFYSGSLSDIDVVVGKDATESKLNALLEDSDSFIYSNSQNWNKNEGFHTGATFDGNSFTYQYDEELDLSDYPKNEEGYTHDLRFMTGVTDRVFLSGNYYYEYEISGPITGVQGADNYGLFYNWINSAQRNGIYYKHEAMLCIKENSGLEKVHFDGGNGTNGDGVGGWTGGTAFGGSDSLKSDSDWQAAYKQGLVVRIERIDYSIGESATYKMSVSAKSNPELVLASTEIVVDAEDKEALYGGYDWVLFGTQFVNCTVSNVSFGKIHNYATEGTIVTHATCGEDGVIRYYCTDEGYEHLYIEGSIPATGNHNYDYTYTWNPTAPTSNGIAECTAYRECSVCHTHDTETVSASYKVTTTPSDVDGAGLYTATFENAYFEQQTKTIVIPQDEHVHTWVYTYSWAGTKCTAERDCEPCNGHEEETVSGVLVSIISPARSTVAGSAIYTATFEKADFNVNDTNSVRQNHKCEIPANTAFAITAAGRQVYTFADLNASKYYYIEAKLSAPKSMGWVGLIHSVNENNYFYDAVSYSATENYTHSFADIVSGSGKVYSEPASYYEGVTKSGLTGADFGTNGMTIATLRDNEYIHTFINGKRIATYLVNDAFALANSVPALYFNDNGSYYDGNVSDIVVISGKSDVETKLGTLTAGSSFNYANTPNWNKNNGTHTDATFTNSGFTYTYDSTYTVPSGGTSDRRYLNGVTDRVFFSGNYYYQYEVTNITTVSTNLFYNWINSFDTIGGYHNHEAMLCFQANTDGMKRITFNEGSGANGDGVGGWVGGTAGGGFSDYSNTAWKNTSYYEAGLIIRIERIASTPGVSTTYRMSVTSKANPSLTLVSNNIVVSAENKQSIYGGYDWILFGMQNLNCTVSNVTYGRLHNYADEGTVITQATCGTTGVSRHYCTDEGFEHLYIDKVIPATGNHDYDYTYTWNPENPEYNTATVTCNATRVCSGCNHTETASATGIFSVIEQPGASKEGEGKFVATFTEEGYETQTKTITIPSSAHVCDFKYSYVWSSDYATCTATGLCDCENSFSENVKSVCTINPATKDAVGNKRYTVTFANALFNTNAQPSDIEKNIEIPANTAFSISDGGDQFYAFKNLTESKYYYIEVKLAETTTPGFVGIAHMSADGTKYFFDAVSYSASENYLHAFGSVIGTTVKSHDENASYYEGASKSGLTGANFGTNGMTIATLRADDYVYMFINGVRIATYLVEDDISDIDTAPKLYFTNNGTTFYNANLSDITVIETETKVSAKLTALTTGSSFNYANTPNWNKNNGTHTDATFTDSGFTYAYDSTYTVPSGGINDRRYVTGVTDRVFLAGDYFYQYEITDIDWANAPNGYGLFYNWINTKTETNDYYLHEANFCMKLDSQSSNKLQRLTFDKGSGTNGDGANGGWSCNTTAYGGNSSLADNASWQAAREGGLIVRIERTVKDATTDVYKISVTAKNDNSLKIESTEIEVTNSNFGGYNWVLFGTQSVNCTISNVTFGRI